MLSPNTLDLFPVAQNLKTPDTGDLAIRHSSGAGSEGHPVLRPSLPAPGLSRPVRLKGLLPSDGTFPPCRPC